MSEASGRSASAARQGGDAFQHLVAWSRILRSLPPQRGLDAVELEAIDVGNVDDVVIRFDTGASDYAQIRYGVDLSTPIDSKYFLTSKPRGTSLLQKFHDTWRHLGGPDDHPTLQLITNKLADPADPVLSRVDGRTSSLGGPMRTAAAGTKLAAARAEWAGHLEVDEDELLGMLDDLKLRLGCQFANEHDHAASLMLAAGMLHDPTSVSAGIDLVRSWVLDGKRKLTADEVRHAIDALDLNVAVAGATLLIQAIDYDLAPEDADVALDWVAHYDGDDPKARRHVRDGAYEVMHSELRAAADLLIGQGHRRVVVRGPMRLATWFAAGEGLSEVRGTTVVCGRDGQQWSSDDGSRHAPVDSEVVDSPGRGDALAVALAFAADPTEDVRAFIRRTDLPVSDVVRIGPPEGRRIASSAEAAEYVLGIKDEIRSSIRQHGSRQVHLFIAAPAGLALLLGHRWNRIAPTTVWEDLGLDGYEEAYHFSG